MTHTQIWYVRRNDTRSLSPFSGIIRRDSTAHCANLFSKTNYLFPRSRSPSPSPSCCVTRSTTIPTVIYENYYCLFFQANEMEGVSEILRFNNITFLDILLKYF